VHGQEVREMSEHDHPLERRKDGAKEHPQD
jgi:hypothetical protein